MLAMDSLQIGGAASLRGARLAKLPLLHVVYARSSSCTLVLASQQQQ
jgi:hypothetical protein